MVRSMTGFGRGEVTLDGVTYTVEVKSVNHRYFEFSSRMPRSFIFLEEKLKKFFASKIARGKVEVFVGVDGSNSNPDVIKINEAVAISYVTALKELKSKFGLAGKISVSDVAANNDIFITQRQKCDEETVWNAVSEAAGIAVDAFIKMREVEGARLFDDIVSRCDFILEKVAFVETRSPETLNNYRTRLETKMREILEDNNIDEQRLLTETAIFADKIAVDEETVRLKSHISQLKTMLEGSEAVGRKLDFVVQEMNRETNTIGSKAQDLEIAHTVVEMKAEIEKIREQIQNIE